MSPAAQLLAVVGVLASGCAAHAGFPPPSVVGVPAVVTVESGDDLCARLIASAFCGPREEEDDAGGACTCEVEAEASAPGVTAKVMRVRGPGTDVGEVDSMTLHIDFGDGPLDLGEVATGWDPGAFGIHNDGQVRLLDAFEVPGVGAVVLLDVQQDQSDSDLGMNALTSTSTRSTWYCFKAKVGPRCVEVTTASSVDVGQLMEGDEPDPSVYGAVGEVTWSREVDLDAETGLVAVGKVEGAPRKPLAGTEPRPMVRAGKYTLEKLMTDPGVVLHEAW